LMLLVEVAAFAMATAIRRATPNGSCFMSTVSIYLIHA
jgi:hypothetical protein